MKRRVFSLGFLVAIICFLMIVTQKTDADSLSATKRHKTVEIKTLQYVWELVSNRDGQVVCEIVVEHPNRPTYEETISICGEQIFPLEPTPTMFFTPTPGGKPAATPTAGPTPEPFNLAEFFRTVTFRFVNTRELVRTVEVPVPDIIVNLVIPPQNTGALFVSIYAYEPILGEHITQVRGVLNGGEFYCPSNRCDVPIQRDSMLEFWAESSFGDESQHVQATLQVLKTEQGYQVQITSLVPITYFQDSCSSIWGTGQYPPPSWASFPPLPDDLNTMKPYQYLAGQLIFTGVVNAQNCPGNGLSSGGGPNSCGLDQASQAVIDWQNQFDLVIWDTARQIGIPPRLIKTLIEQESQFWPSNGRRTVYEYGLGQLSQTGVDVALRWDNELFNTICNGLLYDCSIAYGRLPSWGQATVRGGMMKILNSECATCAHGIDLASARDSIPILARTLRSNCRQVKYILDNHGLKSNYEDLWRMTFVSYHSGYECLSAALDYVKFNDLPATWDNISYLLTCPSGRAYVDDFWKSLKEFDVYRLRKTDQNQIVSPAVIAPTPTPTQTPVPPQAPTKVTSLARIRVLVYVDKNHNQYPEDSEKVNNITVQAQFKDGSILSAQTEQGEVVFDLKGRPIGGEVVISLPDLYRSQKVRIVQDGEIPIIFRLEEPVFPPVLP